MSNLILEAEKLFKKSALTADHMLFVEAINNFGANRHRHKSFDEGKQAVYCSGNDEIC